MARFCTVCLHAQRAAIDAALLQHATGYRRMADQFGVSASALQRHEHEHLGHAFEQVRQAALLGDAASLMHAINALNVHASEVLFRASDAGDDKLRLAAIEHGRRLIETAARIGPVGELESRVRALELGGQYAPTDSERAAPLEE